MNHPVPNRLKVLFVSPWYPTTVNPVPGIFVHELCVQVAATNEVRVVAFSLNDNASDQKESITEDSYEGLSVVRYRQNRGFIPKARFIPRLIGQIKLLKRVIAEFKPDIIHATTYHAALPAVIVGRSAGIPVVAAEYYSGFYLGQVQGVEKIKAKWSLNRANCVISISRYLLTLLKDHGIEGRFEIVPIGVETKLFHPLGGERIPNNPLQGVMVASLLPIKGYTYLLDALQELRKRNFAVLIHVAGDGPDRAMLLRKAEELGVTHMIKFHGVLTKVQIADLMQKADFAITSTLGETFGAGIAEGLASGLPTVATNVGAVPELIDETRGILVQPADGEALAEGIVKLAGKLDNYDRKAIALWTSERFAHNAIRDKFMTICHELVGQRRKLPV